MVYYILGFISLIFLVLSFKKKNKVIKGFYILFSIIILSYIFKKNNLINYIINFIYNPNILFFLIILGIINILLITMLFKKKDYIKNITLLFLSLDLYYNYLIIKYLINNNISVFNKFYNIDYLDLINYIEFNFKLFVAWIIILRISKLIKNIISYSHKEEVIIENNDDYNDVLIEYVPIKKKKSI